MNIQKTDFISCQISRSLLVACGLLGLASSAHAWVDWSLEGAAGYDTNPGRVAINPSGSPTLYMGTTVLVDEMRPRWDVRLGANVGYIDFLKGGYRGQVIGSLSADLRYALIPKILFWNVDDRFGQTTTNVLAPARPNNRTDVNVFSTGPTLVLPLNAVTRLQADARYGIDTFRSGQLPDDTRYTGSAGLIRQLGHLSEVSLNGDYTQVKYGNYSSTPDTLFPSADLGNYTRESAFVRYHASNKLDTLQVDAGMAKASQAGQSFTSPLLRGELTHRLSAYWTVGASGAREYSDAALAFGNEIAHSGIPLPNSPPPGIIYTTQSLPLVNQPMLSDSGRLNATWSTVRTTFTMGASVIHERYLIINSSNDNRTQGDLGFTRRLNTTTDLHLGASYAVRQFLTIGQNDKTLYGNATYSWQFDPEFQLYGTYNFEKRDSTARYGYTDNRVMIGLRYTPGRREAAARSVLSTDRAFSTGPR